MTLEEYKKKIQDIDEAAKKDKRTVAYEYAMSNNPVCVGDIVSDGNDKITVDKIKVFL